MPIPFWDPRGNGAVDGLDEVLFDNPWDILTLAGQRVPGLPKVSADRKKDVDVKKPKGSKGANITFNGDSPANVTIEVTIWTPKQWAAFQEIVLPLVDPPKADAYPSPIACSHPELALKRVKSLFFTEAPKLELDGTGIGVVTLTALEWFPKPKPVSKVKPRTIEDYIDVHTNAIKFGQLVGPTGLEAIDAKISPNLSGGPDFDPLDPTS